MKIVVALDSFKGSLTAPAACRAVARGLRRALPEAEIDLCPMADGGEGTARALLDALGGEWRSERVEGPLLGMEVEAGWALLAAERGGGAGVPGDEVPDGGAEAARTGRTAPRQPGEAARPGGAEVETTAAGRTAVVEMAAASGLTLLTPAQRDPLATTTYGTGQLLAAAARAGAGRIQLAVGGSATVDGGVGAARALGYRFLDAAGEEIGPGGGEAVRVARILPPPALALPPVEVLCDVDNPLLGERGAARVFGPQKGAGPRAVERLEAALARLAAVIARDLGRDVGALPGGGAAGGLAAGAVAFCGARLVSGVDAVMAAHRLAEHLAGAAWVITGEGRLDEQSLGGKVVSGVARLARAAGARVAVLAGSVELAPEHARQAGIEAACAARPPGMPLEEALERAEDLLAAAAHRLARERLPARPSAASDVK